MLVDANSGNSAANVTGAIRQAARLTGTSFQYLVATAKVESNFNPTAKVSTSSAGGLFQFIDRTWLATLKDSGAALGYGKYAAAITKSASGNYTVPNPEMRRQIMALRDDPAANAAMAGAFTKSNAAALTSRLGRQPSEGELYIAHFLGASGAGKLIGMAAHNPNAKAADYFAVAARANRSIFYDSSGEARSLSQVTNVLAGKYDVARASSSAVSAALAPSAVPAETAAATASPGPATVPTFLSYIPANVANTYAGNGIVASRWMPEPEQTAQALKAPAQDDDRREALSNAVRALWTRKLAQGEPAQVDAASNTPPPTAETPSQNGQTPGGGFDLFGDQGRNVRSLFTGT